MSASAPAMAAMAPAPAGAWYRYRTPNGHKPCIEKVCSSWPKFYGYDWVWQEMVLVKIMHIWNGPKCLSQSHPNICNNWFSTIGRRGKMKGSNYLSPGGSYWCSVSMNLALTTCHYLQRFGPAHLCREGHLQQNCRFFWGLATVTRKPYRLNMGWTLWASFWYSA